MSRIALAAAALFLVNTLLVAGIIVLTTRERLWSTVLGFSWSIPHYLAGAVLVSLFHAVSSVAGWQSALLSLPALYLVYRSYQIYLDRLDAQRQHAEQMTALHLRTIEALALAIEAKDETTHEHLGRVQVYALEVGKQLGLKGEELEALRAAAVLHDIGKLAVPEHIINKPGKLTPEEFEKMKIHPGVGAEILETVQFPYPVVPIVRGHHEKWDGSGYPDGLKGHDIPMGARIIAAVDCLDALASDRQYRRAMPLDQAMEIVRKESGRGFDPKIVEILSENFTDYERKAKEQTRHTAHKLSLGLKVTRGGAPAAGYERSAEILAPAAGGSKSGQEAAIADELCTLLGIIKELGPTLRLEETFALIAIRLRAIVPFDAFAGYVVKDEVLIPLHVTGEESRLFSALRIPVGQGLSGWVAENRKSIVNGNPAVEPGYLADASIFTTLRSASSVPIESRGRVTGVLTLYSLGRNAYSHEEVRRLETVSATLGGVLEKRETGESPARGLVNSAGLLRRLQEEVRRCQAGGKPVWLVLGDWKGFEETNRRFGAAAGAQLLEAVARKFQSRADGYVTPLSGGEFAAVLPGVAAELSGSQVEQTVREAGQELFGDDSFGDHLRSLVVGVAGTPGERETMIEDVALAFADARPQRDQDVRGSSA